MRRARSRSPIRFGISDNSSNETRRRYRSIASLAYEVTVRWTGDLGSGTSAYAAYARDHAITRAGAPPIEGSSDPAFRGAAERWSPEELFLASISACHQLWYLHLCAVAGIVVRCYVDEATAVMETRGDGGGRFTEVRLRPAVVIASGELEEARRLHESAHRLCFIANSVNVPIAVEPAIEGPG